MTPQILLIEDDEDLRAEISEFLSRRQNKVYDCGSLAEAREWLRKRTPDVVISDIRLPDGDGASFCMTNAAQFPKTKWLLMSGDSDRVRQTRRLKREPNDPPFSVLDKPVPTHLLEEFVRLALMQTNQRFEPPGSHWPSASAGQE